MEQSEIRPRRKALRLSITALAEYIGASQQYLSQLENNAVQDKLTGRNASKGKLDEIDAVLTKLEKIQEKARQEVPIKKPRAVRESKEQK